MQTNHIKTHFLTLNIKKNQCSKGMFHKKFNLTIVQACVCLSSGEAEVCSLAKLSLILSPKMPTTHIDPTLLLYLLNKNQ